MSVSGIEARFAALAHALYRHPVVTLAPALLLVVFLCFQIPEARIDVSAEALLRHNDPARLDYDDFRDRFGRPEFIVLTVTGPRVFDTGFLSRLESLHQDIETRVPHLRRVTSLVNARDTRGDNNALVVGELLDARPVSADDLSVVKRRALDNAFYRNGILSEDGAVTAVIIETEAVLDAAGADPDPLAQFDDLSPTAPARHPSTQAPAAYFSERENAAVVGAVMEVVARHDAPDFTIAVAGEPVVLDVYNRSIRRDIQLVVALSLLTVGVFLALMFRRVSGVLLPQIVIVSALFSTAGCFALLGVTIKITTIVLPAFLLAVSVGDAVHVLAIFYRRLQQGRSKEDAVADALAHSGLAIVLTSLTTAVGLLSFSAAKLTAIADIGLFGALGVMLALVYTVVMLPALIAVLPIDTRARPTRLRRSAAMDRTLSFFARLSVRHPWGIVTAAALLAAVSIALIFNIRYAHNVVAWLPAGEPIQRDVRYIDHRLRGSIAVEVVIDTGRDNGVHEPALLGRIERASEHIAAMTDGPLFVGKVISVNDILKEVHRALNDNDPAFYRLPADRRAVAQELLLFQSSGSDDLERIVDSQYRRTRLSIKVPWVDAVIINRFVRDLSAKLQRRFGDGAVTITGIPALMARSIPAALQSMAVSYGIAFIVITAMVVLLAGEVKIGLTAMVANLLPIGMVMGVMGALDLRLDMSTIMIGSIALGIVVDDTVHFLYNFKKSYRETGSVDRAVEETLLGTGRALLLTSVILSSGFFILVVSSLSLLTVFGLLTGAVIVLALLADFLLFPALLTLVLEPRREPSTEPGPPGGPRP